jgi:hypothetical protein
MNCPYCQAPLNVTEQPGEHPAVCPHCLSNIADPRTAPAGNAPNLLRDIRHRTHFPWQIWLLLGAGGLLCVGQIVYAKIQNATNPPRQVFDVSVSYVPGFLGLDVLGTIAIGMLIWRYNDAGEEPVTVAQVLNFLGLMFGLFAAIVIFFCVVCFGVA